MARAAQTKNTKARATVGAKTVVVHRKKTTSAEAPAAKRTYKSRSGMRALRQIYHLQNSHAPLLMKSPFCRLLKVLTHEAHKNQVASDGRMLSMNGKINYKTLSELPKGELPDAEITRWKSSARHLAQVITEAWICNLARKANCITATRKQKTLSVGDIKVAQYMRGDPGAEKSPFDMIEHPIATRTHRMREKKARAPGDEARDDVDSLDDNVIEEIDEFIV